MTENSNPSYETLIKRLQQIYQQTQSNKESIQNSQPDNSKIYLDQNWLQNIGIIADTRTITNVGVPTGPQGATGDTNGTIVDQPIHPIIYTTLVQDVIKLYTSYLPINSNIVTGDMPMTVNYLYQDNLPNVTKEIIPFLEYQTTFSAPSGNMNLTAGFLWNVDLWVDYFKISYHDAMGPIYTIWDGIDPPLISDIEISEYQVNNQYTYYTQQSWGLSFTSSEGGVYGGGATVGVILLSIYDTTDSVYINISSDVVATLNPTHVYEFYTWSNSDEFAITFSSSLMKFSSIVVTKHDGAYIALWNDEKTPFYVYLNEVSAPPYTIGEYLLFPPSPIYSNSDYITFEVNPDGPTKYSDIIQQSLQTYVSAPPSYDPFYIRKSKSTDTTESWQVNVNFGAVVTSPGIKTEGTELPQYNDLYSWISNNWELTPNHTTLNVDQYLPIESDMTARVRVVVRPIVNWKKTDKYQF